MSVSLRQAARLCLEIDFARTGDPGAHHVYTGHARLVCPRRRRARYRIVTFPFRLGAHPVEMSRRGGSATLVDDALLPRQGGGLRPVGHL